MHPEIADFVAGYAPIDISDLPAARAAFAHRPQPDEPPDWLECVDVTEHEVSTGVRVYQPRERTGPLPAIVDIHGGSYVIGDLDTNHLACGTWAQLVPAVVVNVDYRLAPEAPYPAGLEDCYAALQWTARHATELGVDPARIAISGSSAGGGLAAAVALLARDRGGPSIALQVLNYPTLDDRRATRSMSEFTDTPVFDTRSAELAWHYYLAGQPADAYAAPARATDLTGLPPAFILGCEFDPLRDEGLQYGVRLVDAGVQVELHQYPGTVHGFDVMPAGISTEARQVQLNALRRLLGAA